MRREDSLAYAPELLDPFEYIFHIMLDLEFLEKVHIFIFEGLFGMLKSKAVVLTLHVDINGKKFDERVQEHEH